MNKKGMFPMNKRLKKKYTKKSTAYYNEIVPVYNNPKDGPCGTVVADKVCPICGKNVQFTADGYFCCSSCKRHYQENELGSLSKEEIDDNFILHGTNF